MMRDEHDFDQWLQQELKRNADYVNDDGFTDGVMAAIPAQPSRTWPFTVAWTLCALLTGALALALFPGWEWVYSLAGAIAGWSLTTIMQIGATVSLLLVLLATALVWNED